MLTNLIATIAVCVVTNVAEVNNAVWGPNDIIYPIYPAQFGESIQTPATEKTVTTTVKEVITLTFKWRGQTFTAQDEKVLSETAKVYKKREEWEAVESQ